MDLLAFILRNSNMEKTTLHNDSTAKTMATVKSSLMPLTKSTSTMAARAKEMASKIVRILRIFIFFIQVKY
jgi:hypothetical protein